MSSACLGWGSDCELGKGTYWPEQVTILTQLFLMFYVVWEVQAC